MLSPACLTNEAEWLWLGVVLYLFCTHRNVNNPSERLSSFLAVLMNAKWGFFLPKENKLRNKHMNIWFKSAPSFFYPFGIFLFIYYLKPKFFFSVKLVVWTNTLFNSTKFPSGDQQDCGITGAGSGTLRLGWNGASEPWIGLREALRVLGRAKCLLMHSGPL